MPSTLRHLILILLIVPAHSSPFAPQDSCETIDGDCPSCPFFSSLDPVAEVHLSKSGSTLVASAIAADAVLRNLTDGKHIQRFDDPNTGLHTSLFYFCCHSLLELGRMKSALRVMKWQSFVIDYDDFWCNNDHANKTVYLHALPSNQTSLFAWAALVEQAMKAHNVTVHHPRKSRFHMTLARVDPEYPIDAAVQLFRNSSTLHKFGSHKLCSFSFLGETFTSSDGC